MTWEGVPWAVGDGAEVSVESARLLAYGAFGGGEGVIAPTDCKVTASAVPDGNVNIAVGGVAILNRFTGGSSQAYIVRNLANEVKAMTPQGAGGVRYDLVCVIVEDPEYAGNPAPVSVPDGPYLRTYVVENVPSTTRFLHEVDATKSGYALARVKFDASDATVAAADITDLRQMAQPRTKIVKKVISSAAGTVNLPGALGTAAPGDASWSVDIPEWAQRVILEAIWSGVQMVDTGTGSGAAAGTARASLGSLVTSPTSWSEDATAANKPVTATILAGEDLAVTSPLRGTAQTMKAELAKTSGSGMTARCTNNTTVSVTATFYEAVA